MGKVLQNSLNYAAAKSGEKYALRHLTAMYTWFEQ